MLQRDNVTAINMTKDAGDIIAKIKHRRDKVNIECEYIHCRGHVSKLKSYKKIPVELMMNQCHEEENKVQMQVSCQRKSVRIENPCDYSLMIKSSANYRLTKEVMR